MRIGGSAVLVTGGASGLGRATAEHLSARGAHVVALDVAPARPAGLPAAISYVTGDVTSESDVLAAVGDAVAHAPLRAVVNCAGVLGPAKVNGRGGPAALDGFVRTVSVNLVGTFNVIRLAVAEMRNNGPLDGDRGVIVNTASVAAFDGQIGQAAYAASKAGIVGMTLPLARELAGHQIRVVTLAPGAFRTPMMDSMSEAARASVAARVPHPARLGDPAEYAALVFHALLNPMLNGEVIRIDGALRMAAR